VDIMMTPGDIDKLQRECDFEHMKETIDKQQTQIRELIDKNKVVDLDYKEEYYKLQKENYKLKQKIEEYQEALLNICSK
jgi:FtsZ-binding cell division protein ZapB